MQKFLEEYINALNSINHKLVCDVAFMIKNCDLAVFCGNGGSYANATHMAGDLLMNSKMHGNTVAVGDNIVSFSATCNDFCYEDGFVREFDKRIGGTIGKVVVVLLSTSGKSPNILAAGRKAKEYGCLVVSMVGSDSSYVNGFSDIVITVDNIDAGYVEAVHGFIGHMLVRLINGKEC
jgi:D-sedoheptulose 7-phosphate isomerase